MSSFLSSLFLYVPFLTSLYLSIALFSLSLLVCGFYKNINMQRSCVWPTYSSVRPSISLLMCSLVGSYTCWSVRHLSKPFVCLTNILIRTIVSLIFSNSRILVFGLSLNDITHCMWHHVSLVIFNTVDSFHFIKHVSNHCFYLI